MDRSAQPYVLSFTRGSDSGDVATGGDVATEGTVLFVDNYRQNEPSPLSLPSIVRRSFAFRVLPPM